MPKGKSKKPTSILTQAEIDQARHEEKLKAKEDNKALDLAMRQRRHRQMLDAAEKEKEKKYVKGLHTRDEQLLEAARADMIRAQTDGWAVNRQRIDVGTAVRTPTDLVGKHTSEAFKWSDALQWPVEQRNQAPAKVRGYACAKEKPQ